MHQWIIEPTDDRFLYIRMNGEYLRRHSPIKSLLVSESGLKSSFATHCSTKARFILTNGDGMSITVCPAIGSVADSDFVEIFSSGWDTYNDFKEENPIRSVSVEYMDPDDRDYQFTWFEMVPRVSLGLVGKLSTLKICMREEWREGRGVFLGNHNHEIF